MQRTKREDRIVFLLIFISALALALVRDSTNVDEIWNYTFGSNIAMGLVPYRDFNLLQTPAACMINGLIFTVLGRHLLVLRLAGVMLFTAIGMIMYRGGRMMGGSKLLCLLLPASFLLMFQYNVFFEYSCLIVICTLIMLYWDLKVVYEESFEGVYRRAGFQFLVGIAGGIAVMSKQTYGGFIMAAGWISLVVASRFLKLGRKEGMRLLFFRMLGSSLPCFGVLFYLLAHGAWDDFWDMCVLGISNFSSRSSFLDFLKSGWDNTVGGVFFLAVILLGLLMAWRCRGKKEGRGALLILIYGLLGCINLIPLANTYHLITCLVSLLWILVPVVRLLQDNIWIRRLTGVILAVSGIYIFAGLPIWQISHSHFSGNLPHLEGIWFPKESWENYLAVEEKVGEYLADGREVYLPDNQAAWYLIPHNRYNKYLDMFLHGNLGTKTPGECLEETLGPDAVYFMPSSQRGQYQYPKSDVDAFRDTWLEPVETVADFEIYKVQEEKLAEISSGDHAGNEE